MAIKQSAADIPREASAGNPPDEHPRYGQLLAQAWSAINDEHYHQKSRTDVPRYVRLSWAGACARLVGYRLLDRPESNPPDLAAIWRMSLGTMVHELLQEALVRAFPTAEIEKNIGAESDALFGFPVSGRTDVFLVDDDGKRIAIEVKSINGFGFKKSVGARGVPEGPRGSALYQAALNGRAHNADEIVIVYLSLECLSDRELTALVTKTGGEPIDIRKFVAEYTYSRADLDALVDAELKRLAKIVGMVDLRAEAEQALAEQTEGGPSAVLDLAPLPPRSIPLSMPARARVTDPLKGTWALVVEDNVLQAGESWECQYCSQQLRCAEDGPS